MSSKLRKSYLLESIQPDCDWKRRHKENFQKIQNNQFEDKQWIQPSCDQRTYKYLELNNGIKVLLIYDNKRERKVYEQRTNKHSEQQTEMKRSVNDNSSNSTDGNNYYTASLCVNRGYYADFEDAKGIAHYCEHMIFMGNDKYAKENEWDEWLAENGGAANASTSNLFTNYIFDIAPKGKQLLFEALDRFAHNFISPLFKNEASERELNSIENEFSLHKTDDAYKQWLVLKQHVLKSASIPFYKFGSGNKLTLDKPDINEKLMRYWSQNYLPQNMSLVILSDVNLDELETFVADLFEQITVPKQYLSDVQVDQQETAEEKLDANAVNTDMYPFRLEPNLLQPVYGKLFRVNSVKEFYSLDIYWMLNGAECREFYHSSPTCLLSELFGHEGKGSLYQLLNNKNYVNSLSCGFESNPEGLNHSFELFEINMDLTETGYDAIYEIIDYVFQYLALIKRQLSSIIDASSQQTTQTKTKHTHDGIVSFNEYYEESKRLNEISFNFSTTTDQWEFVEDLSVKLHMYPIYHLLSCDFIYWKYDPVLLFNAIKELTPDRCTIMLLSTNAIDTSDANESTVHTEPYLETKYTIEDIPTSQLQQWSKYIEQVEDGQNEFHLPCVNTFIPTDLSLLPDSVFTQHKLYSHFLHIEKKEHCGPELLHYSKNMKLYMKLDRTFFLPKCYMTLVFEHHELYNHQDATRMMALQLFIDMFEQQHATNAYLPTLAGLEYSLERSGRGLKLKTYGYSQRLHSYFKHILSELKTFQLDEALFKTQQNALIRRLKNAIVDCEDHLPYIAQKVLNYKVLSIEQELHATTNLSMSDVENVRNFLFCKHENELRIYGCFTGNIAPNTVTDCCQYVMEVFNIVDDEQVNYKEAALYKEYKSLLETECKFLSTADQQRIRLSFSKCKIQCVSLPTQTVHLYSETCVSADEENEGCIVTFQMDDKPVNDNGDSGMGIFCALFKQILSEPFYDHLRTKQQLGYEVSVGYECVANIPHLTFQVISSQYNPHYLTLKIVQFINESFYDEYVMDILQRNEFEKFKEKIDSAIRSRKIECITLSQRHSMYWQEIFTYNSFEFDAKLKEIQALKAFTFEQFKRMYEEKLLFRNAQTKCAVLQVWKQSDEEEEDEEETGDDDDDVEEEEEEVEVEDEEDGEDEHIESVDELKQRVLNELHLSDLSVCVIDHDIVSWQQQLNVLPSYL